MADHALALQDALSRGDTQKTKLVQDRPVLVMIEDGSVIQGYEVATIGSWSWVMPVFAISKNQRLSIQDPAPMTFDTSRVVDAAPFPPRR